MSRPLHRILKRAKQQVPVNKQTGDLLMLIANHQHKDIAKVIQAWLKQSMAKTK